MCGCNILIVYMVLQFFSDKEASELFLQAQEDSSFSPVNEVDLKIF